MLLLYVVAISVLFPIFVYVNRLNRHRDELASIFPITNHFYEVSVFMQFVIYVYSLTIIASLLIQIEREIVDLVCLVSFVFLIVTIRTVIPVQNVLLFLLACQRFLLYFIPSSESYIIANRKSFKVIVQYLYIASISGLFLMFYSIFIEVQDTEMFEYSSIYDKVYVFLDALVILSSLLYIMMLVHVRQITKLTSTMKTRPEKFILLQTIFLLIFKFLGFFISLTMVFLLGDVKYRFSLVYYTLVVVDILTTPFVIQISYICCNKSNVEAVFGIQFRKARTWLMLCCGAPPVAEISDVRKYEHTVNSHALPM